MDSCGLESANTKHVICNPFDGIISYLQDDQDYDEDNNHNGNNLKSESVLNATVVNIICQLIGWFIDKLECESKIDHDYRNR